jgi:hypothetical protein
MTQETRLATFVAHQWFTRHVSQGAVDPTRILMTTLFSLSPDHDFGLKC